MFSFFTKICHISIWENQLDNHLFPGQTAQKLASYSASSTDPTCKLTRATNSKDE